MSDEAVYWDPYQVEVTANPYPVFRRLREEAPLYYNEKHDFYALSRFDDVKQGLLDHETYISGRGAILELIKADVRFPKGVFIFEDPPIHTLHRGLLRRVFTPKKMAALEPQVREFCARCLDPLREAEEFDVIAELGSQMPMRVIGMLLGIPDTDLDAVRERADAALRTEPGKPMQVSEGAMAGSSFEAYVDWRVEHPSDDLMTELLQVEFEDETGVRRRLEREEVLTFVNVLASAGNETTNRLIGWSAKLLSDHPDQRRWLAQDFARVPNAVEEILRCEGPALFIGRYVARDVEVAGRKVPEGSAMLFLAGAANRDDRVYEGGDRFDVTRRVYPPHLAFGFGAHACLGAALARLEGRVALEELLVRFPDWEADLESARLSPTSTVRGWETLPLRIG